MKNHTRKKVGTVVNVLVLTFCTLLLLFPLYWMLVTALTPKSDLLNNTSLFISFSRMTLANIKKILSDGQIFTWFKNSGLVTLISTAISVTVSTLAAYSMSRFRYKANNAFGFFLLLVRMLPESLLIVPLYIIFSKIGLIDSHLSLIICDVAFVIPFAVWMLKGFFDSIPYSLEESAQIDGCTMVQAARLVVIPLTLPGVASVAIYSAILNWSEYLFSRTFITNPRNWMITVGITSYMGEHNIIWGEIMAAAAISILPIILVFVLLSKYLISGMTAGAVKG